MERSRNINQPLRTRCLISALSMLWFAAMSFPAYAQEQRPLPSPTPQLTPTPYPAELIQNPVLQDFYERYRREENDRILRLPTQTPIPAIQIATISAYCDEGFTQSGTRARQWIVATDPNYIPTGSLIEIDKLGTYTAEDTGRLVKEWHVDVWNSNCQWARNWGVQEREIKIIRRGW